MCAERMNTPDEEELDEDQASAPSINDNFPQDPYSAYNMEIARPFEQRWMVRRRTLLFHGIPEVIDHDIFQIVAVADRYFIPISFRQIQRCRRLGFPSVNRPRPRPIIVNFHGVVDRDRVFYTKRHLKGTGITISEFLSKKRHRVFLAARAKFGMTRCWTKKGFIIVLSPDGTQHRITTYAEVNYLHFGEIKQDDSKDAIAKLEAIPADSKEDDIIVKKQDSLTSSQKVKTATFVDDANIVKMKDTPTASEEVKTKSYAEDENIVKMEDTPIASEEVVVTKAENIIKREAIPESSGASQQDRPTASTGAIPKERRLLTPSIKKEKKVSKGAFPKPTRDVATETNPDYDVSKGAIPKSSRTFIPRK